MLGILQKNQGKLKEGNKHLDVATKQGAVSSIALCDITNDHFPRILCFPYTVWLSLLNGGALMLLFQVTHHRKTLLVG